MFDSKQKENEENFKMKCELGCFLILHYYPAS